MARTGEVSHFQPNGSRPRDRAAAAGYGSSWVAENIYMGTDNTPNRAWNFWLNSAVHYAGLTSPTYKDIGIGTARGNDRTAFVLVFGNPGGASAVTIPRTGNTNRSNGGASGHANSAPAQPPPFVVGLDQWGHIMHEVQPGDTLGDIAYIYGYNWEILDYLMVANELEENDQFTLEIGSIILVPPADGTYTPTPSAPTATSTAKPSAEPSLTATPTQPVLVPPVTFVPPSITPTPVALVRTLPVVSATPRPSATPETPPAAVAGAQAGPPGWLTAAIALQVGVLALASLQFARQIRR